MKRVELDLQILSVTNGVMTDQAIIMQKPEANLTYEVRKSV